MINFIIALLILNIMVIAHELGHYLFARKNHIEVKEFAVGFGPTLWSKEAFGTVWMLKLFPLGGYNGLKGESEHETGKGNFIDAPKRAKLEVLIAGSLMNVLLAIVSFYLSLGLTGWKTDLIVPFDPIGARVTTNSGDHPVVVGYADNSPVKALDIKTPFDVVSINGKEMHTAEDISQAISTSTSNNITMVINKDGKQQTITPERNDQKKLGIQILDPLQQIDYSYSASSIALSGISHSLNVVIMTGKLLGVVINRAIVNHDAEPLGYAFSGPVAIVATVGAVVDESSHVVADLASLTGMIGISLAIFNLLPFPGLDGWHMFLIGLEKMKGRKLNEKMVNLVTGVGLLFLLSLGVVIMFKDVWLFFIKK